MVHLAIRQDILLFRARVLATWPREGRAGEGSCAVADYARAGRLSSGRGNRHAASRARGETPRSNPLRWPPTLERRFARIVCPQLARATRGWHVGHNVARFTSIRDCRSTRLRRASSSCCRLRTSISTTSTVTTSARVEVSQPRAVERGTPRRAACPMSPVDRTRSRRR